METITLKDGIFVLTIPIAFNVDNINKLHELITQVEDYKSPTALIITSKHPKIFNAGMDTKSIMENGLASAIKIGEALMTFSARLMTLNCPTIACINGHAIAAGYMLASCTDYKIKRSDFGYIQLNEILNGIITATGPNQILRATLHPCVHRDMLLRGLRYDTETALKEEIVNEECDPNKLIQRCFEKAKEMMREQFEEHVPISDLRKEKLKTAIELCQKGKFDEDFAAQMLNPKL